MPIDFNNLAHSPITILGSSAPGGIYLLRIGLARSIDLVFGRHLGGKPIQLEKGEYLYIGSALSTKGASSLANRLLRHATRSGAHPPQQIRDSLQVALKDEGLTGKLPIKKTVRWHIDYLLDLPVAEITGVLSLRSEENLEKRIAEYLAALPITHPVSPGLGASDYPGSTHLFQVDSSCQWLESLGQKILIV